MLLDRTAGTIVLDQERQRPDFCFNKEKDDAGGVQIPPGAPATLASFLEVHVFTGRIVGLPEKGMSKAKETFIFQERLWYHGF